MGLREPRNGLLGPAETLRRTIRDHEITFDTRVRLSPTRARGAVPQLLRLRPPKTACMARLASLTYPHSGARASNVNYLGAARVSSADLITCKKSRPAPLTIVITASGANRASENVHAASGLRGFFTSVMPITLRSEGQHIIVFARWILCVIRARAVYAD